MNKYKKYILPVRLPGDSPGSLTLYIWFIVADYAQPLYRLQF